MKQKNTTAPTPLEVNEGKHTPGKMEINCPIDDDGNDIIKTNPQFGDQKYFVFKIKNSFDVVGFLYPHSKQSDETMKANAARIVECWNGYDVIKMQLKLTDQQAAEYGRDNEALKKELETGANQYAAKVMEIEALKEQHEAGLLLYNNQTATIVKLQEANRELLEALKNFMIGVAGIASVPKGSTITTGFPAEFFETASLLISKHSKQTT